MQCISDNLQNGANTFFLLYAAALVFFMQAGFAMVCAGCVRDKNVQNSMLKNLLDACGAGLGFWSVGFAFAYGGSSYDGPTTFIGNKNFFLMNIDQNFFLAPAVGGLAFWLFQFAFAATSATIVAGTLAERCQMVAYLCYSIFLSGFIYPVVVHAIWSPNGFLSPFRTNPLFGCGMVDFAGSGVVHTLGGTTALIATHILGARRGRFYDKHGKELPEPKTFAGHSVALQCLGTFILWFGWYGFNPGSTLMIASVNKASIASRAAVTTTLSASAGCVSALFTNLIIVERKTGESTFDLGIALNGAISGLVAITAGCTTVALWAAVIIGITSGWLYLLASKTLLRLKLDDVVDAIPVHMANGIWGVVAVGLFATPEFLEQVYGNSSHPGWFYSWGQGSADGRLLGAQLVGLLFIVGWGTTLMFPFFSILDYLGWFRAGSLQEVVGLDISYHGIGASADDESGLEYVEAMRVERSLKKSWLNRAFADLEPPEEITVTPSNTPGDSVRTLQLDLERSRHHQRQQQEQQN